MLVAFLTSPTVKRNFFWSTIIKKQKQKHTHTYTSVGGYFIKYTYCVSLIYVHRAGNWGEALVAFWCVWRHGRGHTVCKTQYEVFTWYCSATLFHNNEGMLVCCTAGKKDYHQHVKVDSTDHNHKHASPEMDVRDFPCSSCVAEHRVLVGKPDCHRNNL